MKAVAMQGHNFFFWEGVNSVEIATKWPRNAISGRITNVA